MLKLRNTKKIISLALVILSLPISVFSYNVGDIIGTVLSTDIVTYIGSVPVKSYNIDGRTAIIVEPLRSFGLDVYFDEYTRTLSISKGSGEITPLVLKDEDSSLPVGTPVGSVLFTDITTNYEGTPITSFNIGGLTCVYATDFAKFYGSCIWDENARTVNITKETTASFDYTKTLTKRGLSYASGEMELSHTLNRWAEPKKSHLVYNEDGTFYTIEASDKINIEKYDSEFNHLLSFTVSYELPIFGAFYSGEEYNYIAFGKENPKESNSEKVIKIVQYDKKFTKKKEFTVSNAQTTVPFDASGCAIAESEKHLVLHTARSQYEDEISQNPQTQLTVIFDKKTGKILNDTGKFQPNHTSHALNTLLEFDGEKFVTADLSDAAPVRGVILRTLNTSGEVLSEENIFPIPGASGANATGVMIGDLQATSTGYLLSMNSIDHSVAVSYDNFGIEGAEYQNRDVWIAFSKKNSKETKFNCLAKYHESGKTASAPTLTPLSDGKFIAMWSVFENRYGAQNAGGEVYFSVIDKNGDILKSASSLPGARLGKDFAPILADGRLIWYTNVKDGRCFYSANLSEIL